MFKRTQLNKLTSLNPHDMLCGFAGVTFVNRDGGTVKCLCAMIAECHVLCVCAARSSFLILHFGFGIAPDSFSFYHLLFLFLLLISLCSLVCFHHGFLFWPSYI